MEKATIRSEAIFELGERFEDRLDAKTASLNAAKGSVVAFSEASKAIEAILSHVDKDIDEGKIDLEQAKIVKQWISRCHFATVGLGRNAENKVYLAEGQLSAVRELLDTTKKFYEIENAKILRVQEAAEMALHEEHSDAESAEDSKAKKTGRRPSIKSQRQAKAKQDAKNT
jgi:hypothetical protein